MFFRGRRSVTVKEIPAPEKWLRYAVEKIKADGCGARVVPLRGTAISAVSAEWLGRTALLGIAFVWLKTGDIFDILKEKSVFEERTKMISEIYDRRSTMKRNLLIAVAFLLGVSLSGCEKTDISAQYDTTGIEYIAWSDIDTVCETEELVLEGETFLSSMSDDILLSYVMNSEIAITDILGEYDHLIFTNPLWVERFSDMSQLKQVEYGELAEDLQYFLDAQMPILTVDGTVLPDGTGLYEYEGDGLFALPVRAAWGIEEPIEAQNPLIILVDKPEEIFKANSCILPITSSGCILFSDSEKLQTVFDASELKNFGVIKSFGEK